MAFSCMVCSQMGRIAQVLEHARYIARAATINIRPSIDHSNSSTVASLLTRVFSIKQCHSHIKASQAEVPALQAEVRHMARAATPPSYPLHSSSRPPRPNLTLRCTSHSHRHSPFGHFVLATPSLHFYSVPCSRKYKLYTTYHSPTTNAYHTSILKPTPRRLTQLKPASLETRYNSHPAVTSTERRRRGTATASPHYPPLPHLLGLRL
jgi:hypothetical protein